tara:strand:- start:230 stop:1378 length:1149 start_codon:yes stop_codon:yes gene_type:complete
MVMNVASMFRDIIETPEQKQQRQMLERLNQAQSFMAPRGSVASLLNPLAGATFMNIAESQDRVKENLGGMLGLDMRDTSEKVSDQLLGADLSSPQGMRDLSIALKDIAPMQSAALIQEADKAQKENEIEIKTQQEQNNYETLMNNFARRVEEKDPELAAAFRTYQIPASTAVSLFRTSTTSPEKTFRYETISGESVSQQFPNAAIDSKRNYRVQIDETTGDILNYFLDKAPEKEEESGLERDIPANISTATRNDIIQIMGDRFDKFMETTFIPGTEGIVGTNFRRPKIALYSPDGINPYTKASIINEINSVQQGKNISPQAAADEVFDRLNNMENTDINERFVLITEDLLNSNTEEGRALREANVKVGQYVDVVNQTIVGND